ncbi:syndetin-like [Cynara cardunculus var. scolymus]|uniref:syndetin-like n=1 Tax=Cynara cardunculus var. scolymus TaxID=59895 RepID=UPI000D62D67E|nr:syndetin-like [Cynara cardunculus var. scolymus]
MQPSNFPASPLALIPIAFNHVNVSPVGFELSRVWLLGSLLFSQGGAVDSGGEMDLSKVGEKFLSSVRSARSISLLPSTSERPEIPARAATAATIARALASIPPHHRQSLSSSSEELSSIYGSTSRGQVVEELEEEFYEEMFDPVRHTLENLPSEENELTYFEGKAALRLLQLDKVTENLSRQVMEHHEVMVKGMHLVKELEKDMKVANVICMNGRRHLTSSRNEVSRDLIVNRNSRRKQALLDILPVLAELRHAHDMQVEIEIHVDEGNFFKAFQVLSEYLQLLDGFSELLVIQEMSRGVEIWLGKALQKLDSLLLGVCRDFKETSFITVVDAYALIGDVSGLAEKIQSFFMQEVISETHAVLKNIVLEDLEAAEIQSTRLTYSDLCTRVPESKFRECLLATLAVLFDLMCSYHAIMNFNSDNKVPLDRLSPAMQEGYEGTGSSEDVQHADPSSQNCSSLKADDGSLSEPSGQVPNLASSEEPTTSATTLSDANGINNITHDPSGSESRDDGTGASSSGSSWFQLRNDATTFVSQTLQRGRRNLWQLTASRVSVLLSSDAVGSTSIHQFLKNYEDLNTFILAGESFCGADAVEFRMRVKAICECYYTSFHRQNIYALKMVLEKESWFTMPQETIQVVSFAGLVGDGAALILQSATSSTSRELQSQKSADLVKVKTIPNQSGFSHWISSGNPFDPKIASKEFDDFSPRAASAVSEEPNENFNEASHKNNSSLNSDANHSNGHVDLEDENEDLHADFIDEDSQLPSRISKPNRSRNHSSPWSDEEMEAHTGSSICVLRLMDKYARLMQRLDIVNVEFFKGICQFFGIFFHFVFESFGQQNTNPGGKGLNDALGYRLKTALSRIRRDCDQWVKSPSSSSSSSTSLNMPLPHTDAAPNGIPNSNLCHVPNTSFGLKERCAGADTITLVARLLHKSKAHLQSILPKNNAAIIEDFYVHLVSSVPDLVEQIHRTTARLLLHISGYADRIANAKWEVKELGMEHNGYVDLLLGEFKHYKTRLAHGGIQQEVQDKLIGYGLENLSETIVEGLSRVKRCTDEGRALMSLDFQVLITGLQHFLIINVKPKLQRVETFIKAFYLPETEYVHWACAHPEYTKSQMMGLINLVATMKGWKRKTKSEVLEKIEAACGF